MIPRVRPQAKCHLAISDPNMLFFLHVGTHHRSLVLWLLTGVSPNFMRSSEDSDLLSSLASHHKINTPLTEMNKLESGPLLSYLSVINPVSFQLRLKAYSVAAMANEEGVEGFSQAGGQTSGVDRDPQGDGSEQSPGKKANSCHLSSVPLLPACHPTLCQS